MHQSQAGIRTNSETFTERVPNQDCRSASGTQWHSVALSSGKQGKLTLMNIKQGSIILLSQLVGRSSSIVPGYSPSFVQTKHYEFLQVHSQIDH